MDFWNWGEVDTITINGESDFSKYDYFEPDVPVVVTVK